MYLLDHSFLIVDTLPGTDDTVDVAPTRVTQLHVTRATGQHQETAVMCPDQVSPVWGGVSVYMSPTQQLRIVILAAPYLQTGVT